MGLSWEGSAYDFIVLPPGIIMNSSTVPLGAITKDNYQNSPYNVSFVDGYATNGIPYKYFHVNNPGLGQWTYAIVETTPPDTTESLKVYMANHSDYVFDVNTDHERYYISTDQNGNVTPATVNITATVFQGSDSQGQGEHTITSGSPVDDALILVKITSPDYGQTIRQLAHTSNGTYTASFTTADLGAYNLEFIASDNDGQNGENNSQYALEAEHSIYVAPAVNPLSISGKLYIQWALDNLLAIMDEYCPANNNCSLDNNTKKDLNNAISLLNSALGYFQPNDDDRLKTNKGLTCYDNLTTATNKIYSYINNTDFGDKIDEAIEWLKLGGYRIAVISRDDAAEPGACVVSNCEELLQSANTELGKAIDSLKQNNYVYVFNHLTNAWKFSQNMMGANLKKGNAEVTLAPKEYDLSQNYPNPFNPTTTINYQLPEKNHVTLRIYDVLGNLVKTLVDGEQAPGYYNVTWNAGGLASGVYIYRIMSGSFVSTKKLILLK
jgi:hypothetical protein